MAPHSSTSFCMTLLLLTMHILMWTTSSVLLATTTAMSTAAPARHGGWKQPLFQGISNSKVSSANMNKASFALGFPGLRGAQPMSKYKEQTRFDQEGEITRSIMDNMNSYEQNTENKIINLPLTSNEEVNMEDRSPISRNSFTSFVKDTRNTRGTGRAFVGPSALFLERLKKLEKNHLIKTLEPQITTGRPGNKKPTQKFFGRISLEHASSFPSLPQQTTTPGRKLPSDKNDIPFTNKKSTTPKNKLAVMTGCVYAVSSLCSNRTRSISHANLSDPFSKASFESNANGKHGPKESDNRLTGNVPITSMPTAHLFSTNLPSFESFFRMNSPRSKNIQKVSKTSRKFQNSLHNNETNNKILAPYSTSFGLVSSVARNRSQMTQRQRPLKENLKNTNEQSRSYKNNLVRDKVWPLRNQTKNSVTIFFGKASIRGLPEPNVDLGNSSKQKPSFPTGTTSFPFINGTFTRAPWKAHNFAQSSKLPKLTFHSIKTGVEKLESDSEKSYVPLILPQQKNKFHSSTTRLPSLLVALPLERQKPEKITIYPPLSNPHISLNKGNNVSSTSTLTFNTKHGHKTKGSANMVGERFSKYSFDQKLSSQVTALQSPGHPHPPSFTSPTSKKNFLGVKSLTSEGSSRKQLVEVKQNTKLPVQQNFNSTTLVPWSGKNTELNASGITVSQLTNDPAFRITRPSIEASRGLTSLFEDSLISKENNYLKMVNRSLSFLSRPRKNHQSATNFLKNGSDNNSSLGTAGFVTPTDDLEQKDKNLSSIGSKFRHLQKKPSLSFDSDSFANIPSLSPEFLQSVKPPKVNVTGTEGSIVTQTPGSPSLKNNNVLFENIRQSFLRNLVPSELSKQFLNLGPVASAESGKNPSPHRIDTSFNNKYKHSTYKLTYKIEPSESNKKPLGIQYMKYNPLLSLPVETNFTRTYKPRRIPMYELSSHGKAFAGIPDIINEYFNKTTGLMIRIPRAEDGEIFLKKRKVNPLKAEDRTPLRYENVFAIVNPETNVVISLKRNDSFSHLFDSLSKNMKSEKSFENVSDKVTEGLKTNPVEQHEQSLDNDSVTLKSFVPDIRPTPQPTKFVVNDINDPQQFNASDDKNTLEVLMSDNTDNETASIQDWLDFFQNYDDVALEVPPDYYNFGENDSFLQSNSTFTGTTNQIRKDLHASSLMESLGKVLHVSEPTTHDRFQYSKAIYESPFNSSVITSLKSYLKVDEGHSEYAEMFNDENLRGSNHSHKNKITKIILPDKDENYFEEWNTNITEIPILTTPNIYSEIDNDMEEDYEENTTFPKKSEFTDTEDYFFEGNIDNQLQAEKSESTYYYNDDDMQDEVAEEEYSNFEVEDHVEKLTSTLQNVNSDEKTVMESHQELHSFEKQDEFYDDQERRVDEASPDIYSSGEPSKPVIELLNVGPSSAYTNPDMLSEKSLTAERTDSGFEISSDKKILEDELTIESITPHLSEFINYTPGVECLEQQCQSYQASAKAGYRKEERSIPVSHKITSTNVESPPNLFQIPDKDRSEYNHGVGMHDHVGNVRKSIQRRDPLFREAFTKNRGWKEGKKLSLSELLKQNTLNAFAPGTDFHSQKSPPTSISMTQGNMRTPYQFRDVDLKPRVDPELHDQNLSISSTAGAIPWSQKRTVEGPSNYGRFPIRLAGAKSVNFDYTRTQSVPTQVNFGADLNYDSNSRYASRKLRNDYVRPLEVLPTYLDMNGRLNEMNLHHGGSKSILGEGTYTQSIFPSLYYNALPNLHTLIGVGTQRSVLAEDPRNHLILKTLFREATEETRYSQQNRKLARGLSRYY